MKLNPFAPSDNPLYESLFCFGGPSDSGGGGGADKQDAQMDELDQISADFENMSQQQAAGESVTSGMSGGVGRGGSANDNDGDGIPNSIDATPGVDRSNIGAGSFDAFDASKSYLDRALAAFNNPTGYSGPMAGGDTNLLAGPASNLGPQSDGFRATPATMGDIEAQQARAAAAAQIAAQPGIPGITALSPESTTQAGPTAVDGFVENVAAALGLSSPSQAAGIATLGPSNNISRAAGLEAARESGIQAARDAFAAGQAAGNLQPSDISPAENANVDAGREAAYNAMAQGARDAALGSTALSYDPTEPEGGAIGVQSVIDEARSNLQQGVSTGTPTASTAAAAAMEDANVQRQEGSDGTETPTNIDPETGLPVSVRQANAPTFGTVPNYDETDYLDLGTGQDLISARQAAVNAGLAKAAEESPINTGIGIIDNIYNSIMAPNTTAKNMVMEDGAFVAYDMTPQQNVIGAINTQTGAIQPTSGNFFNTELNPYYDQYGRGGENDDRDSSLSTMPQTTAPVAPKTCADGYVYDEASDSCIYQGVARVQRASYAPEPRAEYAYTGLPTLAPTTLRPTFQARGQYAPLFPMNSGS